jgi:uncharacterized Ntn-hydrolase superfamily protein
MESYLSLLILLIATANPVSGTWSILAINKRTNQIGSAMASCLDSDYYPEEALDFLNYGFTAIPLKGGIVAQANIQDETGPAKTAGVPLLRDGHGAHAILAAMATTESDRESITYETQAGNMSYMLYELRQYGVVTYNESSLVAAYTGTQLTNLYAAFGFTNTEETDLSSTTDDYTVSVQGNIVYPNTVEATLNAFEVSDATSFAERLFGALKQGYIATGGDVRCASNSKLKGAVLSWLKVMEDDGTYSIDLGAVFGASQNLSALDSIEEQLNLWKDGESLVSTNATNTSMSSSSSQSFAEEQSESPGASADQSTPAIELSETLFDTVIDESAPTEVTGQNSEEEQFQPSSPADQLRMHFTIALGITFYLAAA